MAQTDATTGLIDSAISEKVLREAMKETFFDSMTSTSGDSIVHKRRNMSLGAGVTDTWGITYQLSGDGVNDYETLEGKAEAQKAANVSLTLHQFRHLTEDRGRYARQKSVYSLDEEGRALIKDWAVNRLDQLHFDVLYGKAFDDNGAVGTPDNYFTKIYYGGSGNSATADVASGDKVTPELLSRVKLGMQTGFGHAQPPMRGVMINGREHFVFLCDPHTFYDMRFDDKFEDALKYGASRGSDHPLFKGAEGVTWDGIVIKVNEKIESDTDGTSSAQVSKCVMLGKQALGCTFGEEMRIISEKADFGNKHQYAVDFTVGAVKAKFTKPGGSAADYAAVGIYVNSTDVNASA